MKLPTACAQGRLLTGFGVYGPTYLIVELCGRVLVCLL